MRPFISDFQSHMLALVYLFYFYFVFIEYLRLFIVCEFLAYIFAEHLIKFVIFLLDLIFDNVVELG